jgi:F0F1-type ATP synthase delta subunit
VIDESQLQKLETLEDYELRHDFLEQLTDLRTTLFSHASTKKLNGNELDGRMMAQLIEQYVNRLNGDDVPVVQNIWDYICEENCNKVYEELFEEYEKMMAEIRGVRTQEEIEFSHQNSLKTILGKVMIKRVNIQSDMITNVKGRRRRSTGTC